MTLNGTVVELKEKQDISASFSKREFAVKIYEDTEYPQEIPVEVVNAKIGLLDPVAVGDKVAVDINLRGSKYNDKRFVSLQAWRISVTQQGPRTYQAGSAPAPTYTPPINNSMPPNMDGMKDNGDDLPF